MNRMVLKPLVRSITGGIVKSSFKVESTGRRQSLDGLNHLNAKLHSLNRLKPALLIASGNYLRVLPEALKRHFVREGNPEN